jgi:Mrp family chromosome partitioning ATPase
MNIWEEVYSRHKKGGLVPFDPQSDQNQDPQYKDQASSDSDSLNQQTKVAGSDSFEKKYYQNSKPRPVDERAPNGEPHPKPVSYRAPNQEPQPQSVDQRVPDRESQPQRQTKPVKARFIPRVPSPGKPAPSYPAILSRMRYSLSDAWANIMLETKQNVEVVLVCGASRKEGATFVSYHLAMFLSAEYSMKVLYVDTNLNHTVIPKIQNLPGVYSFVSEKKDLASLIVPTEYPGLYLLPSGSGKIAKNIGGNMLSREPIEALMRFCRDNFDVTIIDGQPLVSSPVMIEFAKIADITLLICRYAYSREEVSKLVVDKLQKFGITSIGVILNDRKFPVPQKLYKLLG